MGALDCENAFSTTIGQPLNSSVHINQCEVLKILCAYKADCVFIDEAWFHGNRLVASFRPFAHPFTLAGSRHLTREHVLLYLTQASYLFVAKLCERRPYWPFEPSSFSEMALAEQAVITGIDMRFRKLAYLEEHRTIELHLERERAMAGRVFLRFSFGIGEACYGECEGLVVGDGSLKLGYSLSGKPE